MSSDERYKFLMQIFEAIDHPFYVINAKNYEVEMANSAAGVLSPGIKCYQLTHRQDTPCSTRNDPCVIEKIIASKKPMIAHHTHYGADGKERKVELHGFPILDSHHEVSLVVEYAIDVTEAVLSKQDLIAKSQMLRETFENAPDAIVWIDVFSAEIINCNHAACRLLEQGLDEIINRDFHFMFPENRQDIYRPIFNEMLEKNMKEVEVEIVTSGGEIKYCSMSTAVIMLQGKLIFQGIIRDNTEKKKAEKEKEVFNQKIYVASKMASLGELASGVGHEINNPLTVLKGYNKVIAGKLEKRGVEADEVLKIVKVQGEMIERIAEIVNTLRGYSHANEGAPTRVSIAMAVDGAVKLLKNIYQKENVQIELGEISKKIEVMGHQGKIQQIIVNLLSNAKDAILEKGPSGKTKIEVVLKGERVWVVVTDSGKGVSQEDRKKIFDSFYTTKPKGKGTGLGLSISADLAHQMSGKLFLNEKHEGSGAQFILEFPLMR
ncbi:MAG: hypothetical protein A2504_14310 [Bdellovibrionales bacterium RIFOXYD12_FULL_39_22]|nr:MAG: hypothetical protein A2385_04745 [Bdellovibrionales bacterium RIFOXYB1_FULL_39_21]OFZ43456.1 MAG: hypothetical protein A2485_13260 [Bdellovibrionales bacterium RIFOXYC12_FULL_39_17]OFZ46999.1 MAG: hypothetical protein A2404_00320 [Bdellovibrionales bacterium RIFOXYC1_FULL_39_130]OFZ76196.1 MAG: hypothetical protein A2560_07570 [Bdellovibrionales bacterium RIFOXYD1_FULL_39_84]OFZ94431.1 MAG: hypothetical protein A2504_14310 [Bdellovibrionales bacterium RIFOXYD12_FULL_39_22]HLE10528.1 AT